MAVCAQSDRPRKPRDHDVLTTERTYKLEDGPKALDWDRYSELVQRDWRDLLGAAEDHDEAVFQKFLETHPCMVPGGQSMSGPSGHSAFPAALITQPSLPGFFEQVPDFLWLATDSLHIYAVLVEIEPPQRRCSPKAGNRHHSSRRHRPKLPVGKAGSTRLQTRDRSVTTI